MRILEKTILFLDDITDFGLIIIFCIFFFIGGYSAYDSFMLYGQVKDSNIQRLKPGRERMSTEEIEQEIDGKMVAWITVDGTVIDYPIMQGEDNSEYLNKDPFGEYSLAGSIFLDSRNEPDFTDYYNLIYGHHMEHYLMFGALDKYLEEGYLEEHSTGKLIVGETTYKIKFFSVMEAPATNQAIFGPTEYDQQTMPYTLEHSLYIDKESLPKEGEKLIALSTCKTPNTADRTIVMGKLLK